MSEAHTLWAPTYEWMSGDDKMWHKVVYPDGGGYD